MSETEELACRKSLMSSSSKSSGEEKKNKRQADVDADDSRQRRFFAHKTPWVSMRTRQLGGHETQRGSFPACKYQVPRGQIFNSPSTLFYRKRNESCLGGSRSPSQALCLTSEIWKISPVLARATLLTDHNETLTILPVRSCGINIPRVRSTK